MNLKASTRSLAAFGMIAALCVVTAALTARAADTVVNLNGQSQTGDFNGRGPITGSYTVHGPGTFTSTGRVYPNDLSHIVTFDQGAVVWLTTHNAANDGLIVSGKQNCEVRLGNCTVGSCKAGSEICLARYVTLVLTDEDVGASITTKNNSGTTITMQTNPSQQAIIKGAGKLNLIGGGTFRFDSKTTFSNTGLITVDDGTTASLNTASSTLPNAPILVKNGGVLSFTAVANLPKGKVTVGDGGVLDLGDGTETITFSKSVTFNGGSVLRMTVGAGVRRLDTKGESSWNDGNGVYFPHNDGGKVTISPVAGTGLAAGRYTIISSIAECGIEAFALDKTTLGGFNLSLDRDGDALVLVVSENEVSTFAVWSGGASGAFNDANWNDGETFPEGMGARFATSGASVTLDADTPSILRLSFAESAAISGTGTLNVSNGEFFVEAGRTATLDVPLAIDNSRIRKYGAGTLVINAAKQSTIYDVISYDGQVEFHLAAGESVTIPKPTYSDYRRAGGISYVGPGTFTSFRLYPRNYGSTNVVDGGATVILTGNNATDGIMVSGWHSGEGLSGAGTVALGDCTIQSGYSANTLLQREVNIVFTDPVNGTTISTDGTNGSPITVTTDKSGAFYGAGKLNVAGSGTFLFGASAKFHQTGETVVKSGAAVRLDNDVPNGSFRVEGGATIFGYGALPHRIGALTMESGATFGTVDNRTIIAPAAFTCAAGATIDFVAGEASASGVPLLDLRGASLSIGAGSTVRVVLNGAMPNGTYDFIWFDAVDAAQIANLSFTFVDGTESGCTGSIAVSNGAASLTIGGSSAAARSVWRGLGADGAWSTALNWTAQEAPIAGGVLEFDGTNGLVNVNDTGLTAFSALSFASGAGAFDIDLSGAGQGMVTIDNNSGNKQIVRNYVNTGALAKSGSKEVELVDPVIGGKLTMASSSSPLAIRSTAGNTVTVNSNSGSSSAATFRYLGPGAFLTTRIYPNASSVPVSFEEGATVWITTHNGAKDGLIVAGGTDRILKAGYCTIGSRFTDAMTELLRIVTIEFTDKTQGATVTTDNVNGTPITIQTTCNKSATSRNQGYFKGTGRFNIGGHGTFVFNPQTTYLHTGTTFVDTDATAVITSDVGYTNSAITVAGKLRLEGGIVSKRVTVQNGGVIENPGAATVRGGVSLAAGAKMVLPVAADGTVTKAQCAIVAPSSGTATVELACASRSLPKSTSIVLTQGAGLAAGAEAKFAVTPVFGGAPITGIKVKTSVSDGELCVEFISKGTLIIVR